ncbi:hypothetical protein M885DRAFT_525359 [Pelagophyceae sp. CCMP2097]|nr:hypothetical protein M885DRAFT_525359 [Pelagophyceae sp. CCMP2097]
MLSVLQRQAKTLEVELKQRQKDCLAFKQSARAQEARIATQDQRILDLEAELSALRAPPAVVEEVADVFDEAALVARSELDEFARLVAKLQAKLEACQGRLSMAQLRASMADLEKCSEKCRHVAEAEGFGSQLDAFTQAKLKADADVSRLERASNSLKDEVKRLTSLLSDQESNVLEIANLRADLIRRDEREEYLINVHEAASAYDWVDARTRPASGSARDAASMLGTRSLPSLSGAGTGRDPAADVAMLRELGIDANTAMATLEATGGNVQNAIAVLFPG